MTVGRNARFERQVIMGGAKRKNKDRNPIYYASAEAMDKPLSELMESLRNDVAQVRGKLHDIKFSYGWDDRIEHLEGGLTCMLVAMYEIFEEWQKFEEKERAASTKEQNGHIAQQPHVETAGA
jgi:hypothetical protein